MFVKRLGTAIKGKNGHSVFRFDIGGLCEGPYPDNYNASLG